MDTISHKELLENLAISFATNQPDMIYGSIGIGKSYTVKESAKIYAVKLGKKFIEYSSISNKDRRRIADGTAKDISMVYIFIDQRSASMDPSDIKGLPGLTGSYVDWLPDIVFKIASRTDFFGVIFFDEINQALPAVQSSLYSVILDNTAGSLKLSNNCMRLAAGNRAKDRSNVNKLSLALTARFTNEELEVPTATNWINNFAIPNGVYDSVVSYLRFKGEDIFVQPNAVKDTLNFANPRSWTRLSEQMKVVDSIRPKKDEAYFDLVERMATRNIGGAAAITFSAYMRLHTEIDIKEILADPSKIKDVKSIDRKLFALDMIAVEYKKQGKKLIETIGSIMQHIDGDIAMILVQNLRTKNPLFFNQLKTSVSGGRWAMDNIVLFSQQ